MKAGNNISMNIIWTAGSLVLTRCFQVYSDAQRQKSQMQHEISSQLYDKMQDSQEGVEEELDGLCEEFLVREFDHRIDFQVQDSLPRLERWGLVVRNDQDKVQAMPMDSAIEALSFAWAIAYRSLGEPAAAGVCTADLLTGRGSTFGAEFDTFRENQAAIIAALAGSKKGMFSKAKDKMSFKRSSSSREAFAAAAYKPRPDAAAAAAPGERSSGSMAAAAAAALAAVNEGEEDAAARIDAALEGAPAPLAVTGAPLAAAAVEDAPTPRASGGSLSASASPAAASPSPLGGGRASGDFCSRRSAGSGSVAGGSSVHDGDEGASGAAHSSGGGKLKKPLALFKRLGKGGAK
ncbi:hypothetical protein MNEG_15563 [Monoraphidium neglectum]|uniref:Uncharacterized protein n=1 Tax=Monoraphidium neglectum TaxID=145388 RepID=A0A0D2MAM2_9CHLO|nr:hypothetical protein MNEG_15563 [Monoraphidium neglectum]KIY92400.1 hypothetical protein MNEG_15563 [Monoraphidium neglectum]|eukprot:XP_013891420.1 hypothetical protein MNEG_15563 [Monoraphidium neglectum]